LLFGLGALGTAGAQAAAPPQSGETGAGGATVRSEGSRIFLSEGGRETELRLGATPERDRLLRLLEEHGPAGVRLDADPRLIMSGGGGAGFSLWDARKPSAKPAPARQAPAETTTPPAAAPDGRSPRDQGRAADKKG
jgi:hypothetical protein